VIPQSFVQELLGRVDIVDVVDRHVKLKRAGANYVACCPFHTEKSPSFTVSPTKQFYHCFGCGAHGTAVGFLIEYSGLGFVDAVKELAQSIGLKVPEIRSETAQRRAQEGDDLYTVLLKATDYYRAQLKEAPGAIAYLKKRGLSGEIAKRFGIGYAPAGWQNLAAAFSDYDGKGLAAAGLTKVSERTVQDGQEGRRYDVFRDRIMFPIVDVRGNVIGFGGRILETGEPKYLNSPETPVFEKGRELYGLYQARRAIRDAGRVVVVEGYMDVVALAQAGVEYAVATLGTATTSQHVQKLLRQADEVVFCFDGDAAGRRAAWRALENALSQLQDGKQVKFLFLPEGEDPDTHVRKHGRAEFERRLDGAVPLSRFLLEEVASDLATAEGRAGSIHRAKPLLKQMQANALRGQLVRELAEKCRVTPEEVAALCELQPLPGGARPAPAQSRPRAAPTSLIRMLLRLLVSNPGLASGLSEAQRTLLDGPDMAAVAELVDAARESGATTTAMLFEVTRDSQHAASYQDAAGEMLMVAVDDEAAKAELAGAFHKLEHDRVKSEFEQLTASGVQNDRYQEVKRRLAELKGAVSAPIRPPA
jgi:DNA primase